MSTIEELTAELDGLPENTVVLMLSSEGEPINAAYRTPRLNFGEMSWALGGLKQPWTSELLAAGIGGVNGSYRILERGGE